MKRQYKKNDIMIEANYYPIVSSILAQDNKTRFTLLTAESHGGSVIPSQMLTDPLASMIQRCFPSDGNSF